MKNFENFENFFFFKNLDESKDHFEEGAHLIKLK